MTLRVLYLHPFAVYGGATKSLAEMFGALPAGEVIGTVVAPPGVATDSLAAVGLHTIAVRGLPQWDDTRFGHYRGARWLILLRELSLLPEVVRALQRVREVGPFDLIHCNEITAIVVGVLFKKAFGLPLVVHVRSLQRGSEGSRTSARLMSLVRRSADAVIAIDEAVRRTLPADLKVDVIHNGLKAPGEFLRSSPGGDESNSKPPGPGDEWRPDQHGVFTVAIIGVLHRSKGVFELVEAVRVLRDRGLGIRVLIVGENIRPITGLKGWVLKTLDFARDVQAELVASVARLGLEDVVEFTGFVKDIGAVYRRVDAVCFPSHLDAPGRPVFEAALYGLPTIVAMKNPTSDVIIDGVTGLCIAEPTPVAIANAIETLARDAAQTRQMGRAARAHALEHFESQRTAAKTLAVYRRVAGGTS